MASDCIEIDIKLSEIYSTYEQSMEAAAESLEEIREGLKPVISNYYNGISFNKLRSSF